jgi:hypothetical protein
MKAGWHGGVTTLSARIGLLKAGMPFERIVAEV